MSTTYQKIPGPYVRDPKTNKLIEGEWTSPELGALANARWEFTEKIDGTNVRIIWDGHRVTIAGRTDNATFHPDLYTLLIERFGGEDNETLFEQKFGEADVVLYGEGFGPKVQSGGKYADTMQFALFDVKVGSMYLLRENVEDIASYFGIPVVPLVTDIEGASIGELDLYDGISIVRAGLPSFYGNFPAEGIVGKTKHGLLDRRGNRIIVKIKTRDFT